MKTFEFSPRLLTTAVILMLGLIIAAVPRNTTTPFKLTAEQILDEIKSGTQYLEAEQIAQMIVEKEPTLQLIDVRPVTEFEKFSLPGAINIPIDNILASEYRDLLNQDIMTNVFYSNGTTQANEAWMLVRQLGYENNYVLRGGLITGPKASSILSGRLQPVQMMNWRATTSGWVPVRHLVAEGLHHLIIILLPVQLFPNPNHRARKKPWQEVVPRAVTFVEDSLLQ